MPYFFLMIVSIVGIIIFSNRFWIKRRVKYENIFYGILTFALIIALCGIIIKFIEYRNESNKLDFSEYTEIFEKDGKFYMFDSSGEIVEKQSTVGDIISDFFIKDVFDAKTGIPKEEAFKNNVIVVVISAILLVYWLTLLILYEKEEQLGYEELDDFSVLDYSVESLNSDTQLGVESYSDSTESLIKSSAINHC